MEGNDIVIRALETGTRCEISKNKVYHGLQNLAFLSELLLEPNLKLCCLKVIKSGVIAWSEKKR